jgi:hypothetical protein
VGEIVLDPAAGLLELPVGKSTRHEFEARFGPVFEVKRHGTYSTELVFKQGVDAYFCQADASETIFAVQVHSPLAARIEHDEHVIVMGTTTAREAQAILGGGGSWVTSEGEATWELAFEQPDGRELGLHVKRDLSLPQFPLDEAIHLDRRIIKIGVSVVDTDCAVSTRSP